MSSFLRIPSPKDFAVFDGEPADQSAYRRTKNVDDKLVVDLQQSYVSFTKLRP